MRGSDRIARVAARTRRLRPARPGTAARARRLAGTALLLAAPALAAQTPADSAWSAGRRQEARRLYAERLETNPEDQRALLRLGLLRAWDGEYESGLRLLDRVLTLNPDRLDAVVARGRVLAWSGRREAAIDTLRGTLERHPEHVPALLTLAAVLTWEDRDEEAAPLLREAARLRPDDPEIRGQLTRAQLRAGERSAAREALLATLERSPDDPDALALLGDLYLATGHERKAAEVFRRLLPRRPYEGHRGLARALSRQGSLVEAEREWREAVRLAPDEAEPWVGLARVLRWQGRDAAAARALEEARARDPSAGSGERAWVRRRTGPRTSVRTSYAEDSDGNNLLTTTGRASFRPEGHLELSGRWSRADHELDAGSVLIERELNAAAFRTWVQIEPGVELWGEVGQAFYDSADGEDLTTVSGGISSPRRERFAVTLDGARDALAATAVMIRQRVRRNRLRASWRWRLGSLWTVRGDGSYADYRGRFANKSGSGSLEIAGRATGELEIGVAGGIFGFRDDVDDGYFDPAFYGKVAVPFRYRKELRSVVVSLEATPGARRLRREGQPGNWAGTFDGLFQLTYRLAPGRELVLGAIYSRSGDQPFASGDKDYQYGAVQGGLAWTF
ncbi:MAG: tetratricopeptide repeat protein [Gemmatimonadota bacterium]